MPKYLKYFLYLSVSALLIATFIVLNPTTHRYILEKLSKKFLLLDVVYDKPDIGFNTYKLHANLDTNATLDITLDYTHLFSPNVFAEFKGDIAIFSKDANVTIPSIYLEANASLLSDNTLHVRANALDLDATLESNIKTFDYTLHATLSSLEKTYALFLLPNEANGIIYINSKGKLFDTYNLHLYSNDFNLSQAIAKQLEPSFANASLQSTFDVNAVYKEDVISAKVLFNNALASIKTKNLLYKIAENFIDVNSTLHLQTSQNKGDIHIEAKGDIDSRLQAHIYTKDLHIDKNIVQKLDANFTHPYMPASIQIDASLKQASLLDATLNIQSPLLTLYSDLLHVNIDKNSLDSTLSLELNTSDIYAPIALEAKGNYTNELHIHAQSNSIKLAKHLAKKVDANFTKPSLDMTLNIDANYKDAQLIGELALENELVNLYAQNLHVDTNKSYVDANLQIKTKLFAGDTNISTQLFYSNPIKVDTRINTAFETLNINNTHFNTQTQDFSTTFALEFFPSNELHIFKHSHGKFEGYVAKKDTNLSFELQTKSFGKNLHVKGSEKNITCIAQDINVTKITQFFKKTPLLKKATLNGRIQAYFPNFLDFNLSTLTLESDINISKILLNGFNVDAQLDNLKNYQNISILDGNFPGKGLLKATVSTTSSIVKQADAVESHIDIVHLQNSLSDAILTCKDCAIATPKNLIAIKGGVNVNTHTFIDVKIGLLRKNRCAYFVQDIEGSIEKPSLKLAKSSANLVGGVVKSVGVLVKDTAQALTFTDDYLQCTPFYTGVIVAPQ